MLTALLMRSDTISFSTDMFDLLRENVPKEMLARSVLRLLDGKIGFAIYEATPKSFFTFLVMRNLIEWKVKYILVEGLTKC